MKTDTKKQNKLTGSFLIEAYIDFNHERFINIIRTTRYKVYRGDDNLLYVLIALSDPHYNKETFKSFLERWQDTIVNTTSYRTWKGCEKALANLVKKRTEMGNISKGLEIITAKEYVPGKKDN